MKGLTAKKVFKAFFRAEVIFSIICSLIVFAVYYVGLFETLEVRLLDHRFNKKGDSSESEKIILVPITDESIEPEIGVGKWPWNRSVYARVVDFLHRADARVVGFDIFFKNPQEDVKGDAEFIRAIEIAQNVVLAQILETVNTIDFNLNETVEIAVSNAFDRLAAVAANHGFINVEFDTNNSDGVIRKVKLFKKTESGYQLSFPCSIYGMGLNKNKKINIKELPVLNGRSLKSEGGFDFFSFKMPEYTIEKDQYYLVNFAGSTISGRFEEIPFHKIYKASLEINKHFNENNDPISEFARIFKGKSIIVGPKAAFFGDMKVTPYGLMPGMEIHANILANLMDSNFILRFSPRVNFIFFILISIATAIFLLKFAPSFLDLFVLPTLAGLFFFISLNLFTTLLIFIEIIPALMIIVINYVCLRFYQLFIKILIANRQLTDANRALDAKVQEVTQLYKASKGLNEINDVEQVSETILNNAVYISKADSVNLLLFDEDRERVVLKKTYPEDNPILCAKENFELSDQIVSAIVGNTKKSCFLRKKEVPASWVFQKNPDLSEVFYVPLAVKNNLSGIIIFGIKDEPLNKKNTVQSSMSDVGCFTESDRYLIQTFVTQAAVTLENARLYKLAVFDGLTKLYVHRFFQNRLAQEFKRTRRYKTPLAVILSDIDHFKSFNDTYGHQVGDIVLAGTADIFKECVREIDLVARYGGEEFAGILPQTDEPGAMIVAERIRTSLEKANFIHPDGRILKVTVSIGVACYDGTNVETAKELIKQSDLAMYYAKENGRNNCSVYNSDMVMTEDQ